MARTIAKELDNTKDGDRGLCPICRPRRRGLVSANQVWQWSRRHPGVSPFKGRPS